MDSRNALATLVGFAIAAVALGALAAVVGAEDVLTAIGRADPGYVALVAAAIVAWICLWGAALWIVLAAIGTDLPVADAVLVNAGAAFANHVTPFGQAGGEPVAAWLLSDVSDTDYERALAAVTSFDTINVIPSLSLAGVGVAYYATVTTVGDRVRLIAGGLAAVGVVLAALLYLGWRHRTFVEAVLVRVASPPLRLVGRVVPRVEPPTVESIERRVTSFVGGIQRVANDRERLAVALTFSAAGWVAQAVGLWLAFRALGAALPLYVPLFVVPMGAVANVFPTPGGLGGIEAVQVTLLVAVSGVVAATATAAVAIFSVGGFFLTTSLGAAAVGVLKARSRRAAYR